VGFESPVTTALRRYEPPVVPGLTVAFETRPAGFVVMLTIEALPPPVFVMVQTKELATPGCAVYSLVAAFACVPPDGPVKSQPFCAKPAVEKAATKKIAANILLMLLKLCLVIFFIVLFFDLVN